MIFRTLTLVWLCCSVWLVTAQQSDLPRPVKAAGIENFFQLTPRIFSGGQPEGDAAFTALQKLGIKTLISVDGAQPDLERAHRHGMKYIHLPNGYDGISTNLSARLAQAAQTVPGPVFVHCHHGKHRGPTAAAVMCLSTEGWNPAQALDWLKAADTATNYAGLYETVRGFKPPSRATLNSLPRDFPESVTVSGLVSAMVEIDEHWENLKAVRKAGYFTPPSHPDLKPANEAIILMEHFRELQRTAECKELGADFMAQLKQSETDAESLRQLLASFTRSRDVTLKGALDTRFDALAQSCTSCHKAYRDKAGNGPSQK